MDLIDLKPAKPGWGQVWQGSELADWFDKVPSPKCVISMVGECGLGPAISWAMIDDDRATLPDAGLIAAADASIGFLKNGYNLLVHCFEGKFRSTYMDVAIHMRTGMLFADAYALVRSRHVIADLREGTKAQLMRLESVLNSVVKPT